MSLPRRPRPDDWSTNHGRARTALSDRLDGLLDPGESLWLDDHLAACGECRSAAEDYEAQAGSLRAARSRPPAPPRDLWARTAAAIERESGFRDRGLRSGGRQTWFRSPLLPTALVVAVAVGTLISSQLSSGGATPARTNGPITALASDSAVFSAVPGATPLIVGEHVQWISRGTDGRYRVTNWDVPEVCPGSTATCTSAAPVEDQPVQLTTEPTSVFGSPEGNRLIVVNGPGASRPATVSVVPLHTAEPAATPTATATATATPSASVSVAASSSASSPPTKSPGVAPSVTPSTGAGSPSSSPTPETSAGLASPPLPSVAVTPSTTPGGAVQIAENVVLVGQSAAYSPDFGWFAFTARSADGSTGPDIYVWKVGDPVAREMTTDHRSSFGSWTPDGMAVGSTIDAAEGGTGRDNLPARSFLLDPATGTETALPQTGRTWRPSVDPTGHRAVYWAGTLRPTSDAKAYVPSDGRLVIGDWDAGARPSVGPEATRLESGQEDARHETTIVSGQITDWDARWDSTGTKLAVWIADRDRADVGKLSLYDVDPFNGRIDLKKPLLDGIRAAAGFSIADGKLVWAQPSSKAPGAPGRVLVLAWTDKGAGTIETGSDQVVVIR